MTSFQEVLFLLCTRQRYTSLGISLFSLSAFYRGQVKKAPLLQEELTMPLKGE